MKVMWGSPFAAAVPDLPRRIARYYLYHGLASFAIWIPFWSLWIRRHLGSDFELTLVDVVFWVGMLLFQLPAGVISDKYSRKWTLFAGEAFRFLGLLGYALGTSFLEYAVANVLWAVGIVFLVSSDSSFLYDTLAEFGREAEFPAVKGRATLLDLFANATGSFLGGYVVAVAGGRLDLVLAVGAAVDIAGGLVILGFREPRSGRAREVGGVQQIRDGYRVVRRTPGLALIILFEVVITTTISSFAIFRSIYYSRLGFPDSQLGLLWAGFLSVGGISAAASGWAARRLGEERSMALLTVLVGLPLVGVYAARDASPWVVLLQGPLYVAWGLQTPLIASFINRRIDAAQRATVLSMAAFVSVLALLFAEPLVGWLTSVADLYAIGLALGVAQLVPGTWIVHRWLTSQPRFVPAPVPVPLPFRSRIVERLTRLRP